MASSSIMDDVSSTTGSKKDSMMLAAEDQKHVTEKLAPVDEELEDVFAGGSSGDGPDFRGLGW